MTRDKREKRAKERERERERERDSSSAASVYAYRIYKRTEHYQKSFIPKSICVFRRCQKHYNVILYIYNI